MKKQIYYYFILLAVLFFLFSCEEETVTIESPLSFQIQEFQLPDVLSSLSDDPVMVTAKVTHPDGAEGIQSVSIVFQDDLGQVAEKLALYDDGGVEHPESGDVVAFDDIYSRKILPDQLGLQEGEYSLYVEAVSQDEKVLESEFSALSIFENNMPELSSFSFPDSIPAGMAPMQASFTVDDEDGLEDIQWVLIEGVRPGKSTVMFQDTVPNPGENNNVLELEVDSSYSVGREGEYELAFFAEDRAGGRSDKEKKIVFLENTPPQITSVIISDTLFLPPPGSSEIDTVRASIKDSQSLEDIKSATFTSQIRETDGTLSDPSDPIGIFDDGDTKNSGDHVLGDGVFSRIIVLNPNNKRGTYIFTFKAEDRVGQFSDVAVDSIIVK